jgi:hypothetical protein
MVIDEQTAKTAQSVLMYVGLVALLSAVGWPLFRLVRWARKFWKARRRFSAVGCYCAHCAAPNTGDPQKAIAVDDHGYFVYQCRYCEQLTLLPLPNK